MAQRLQFTYDMFRGMSSLSDDELGLLFRSIGELIYDGKNPTLPPKLEGMYYILKPYIEDDIERHIKFIESKSLNGKLGGRPKASFIGNTDNPSNKAKKAKKAKKATDNEYEYEYTKDSIYKYIDIDKYKREFPKKNIDIEFDRMWRWRENNGKKIKKPNQAFSNWLSPKKFEKEYIEGIVDKSEDQWITEMLAGKNKFYEKYGRDKYQEVKDLWIKKCLAQPLSL